MCTCTQVVMSCCFNIRHRKTTVSMVCPDLLFQSFIWISLIAKGVQYDVTHIVNRMCVVRQSTVLVPCKHTSQNEQVSAAEWLFEKSPGQKVRVSLDPAFVGRVEFEQPAAGNCSLLLRDVRESDAGIFRFVLSTTSGRNWTNDQGIQLEVTDAELEVKTESDVVIEGDLIMFVCGSCIPSMTVPTYIWRKDGKLLSQRHGDNMLNLDSVKLEDRGQYSCTISGHERLNSTSTEITVRYPPKSVSVSISASGEIVEGDSVTLNCSSDSNPPAEISWFKGGKSVGSGQIYNISKISSNHSGEYKCRSRNKHGERDSDAVKLNVMYPPKSVTVFISASGEIVEGDSVTLICSSDSNPPALNFSWFKQNQSSAVGSGQSLIISSFNSSHSGRYYCEAENQHGSQRSASVSVSVTESSSSLIRVTVGITAAVVLTSVILMVFSGLLIRRKRATPSGSGHNKTLESPEDAYMSLEPKSRCSE